MSFNYFNNKIFNCRVFFVFFCYTIQLKLKVMPKLNTSKCSNIVLYPLQSCQLQYTVYIMRHALVNTKLNIQFMMR